jgi:catechol 2,3-dioxygenase-like lactoylglutathione lyase family enzyme/predicted enzyme related to lactoylglutathione lyase
MTRIGQAILVLAIGATIASPTSSAPDRAKIFKISYVRLLSSDSKVAAPFYAKLSTINQKPGQNPNREELCVWCEIESTDIFAHAGEQVVLIKDDSLSTQNHVDEVVFEISDAKKMERYIVSRGVAIRSSTPRLEYFDILDPEGHRIGFVQRSEHPDKERKHPSLLPLIHTGFVVKDRTAMEHFYKDILGFRPYWHGGMKDNETDWLDLQVPDGTDWIEFMLNVPADADKHTLGVMNHIALGVPDIHAAQKLLLTKGMKLTEEPQIGRDGKWQLNLYDPDDTRVELMEFTPVEEPCCSIYTGPHPKP